MDGALEHLVVAWTERLLEDLADPATQENIKLLTAKRKKLVENFQESRCLPEPLNKDFIQALNEALSNLSKVVVKTKTLSAALLDGGSPMTPDEMEQRFK